MSFDFTIDARHGAARAARFATPHGVVQSPAFMAVGTQATVKALDPHDLRAMDAQMILANAYHLHLRPSDQLIRELGGLHEFMQWDGPILTDSGGFQVFSLATLRTISEDGVEFQSHIDGSKRQFTAESVMRIERSAATRPSTQTTAWWHGRWSVSGRTACVTWSSSNANTLRHGKKSRSR